MNKRLLCFYEAKKYPKKCPNGNQKGWRKMIRKEIRKVTFRIAETLMGSDF
jgi:hypothetical protein